jgi:hypothetical protein
LSWFSRNRLLRDHFKVLGKLIAQDFSVLRDCEAAPNLLEMLQCSVNGDLTSALRIFALRAPGEI